MPSHRSHSSPAKGRANRSTSPPPRASTSDDEATPLRAQRLATLAHLHELLDNLKAAFQLPSSLTFLPSATAAAPKLDFRANNAPLLTYEDEMVRMLTKLDEVQSEGDMVVRDARKKIVREVEEELERLDGVRRCEWERQQSGGESEQEKKEKVDRMLQTMGELGSRGKRRALLTSFASPGTAPAHAPTSHEVAEDAIEHNQHGKREDVSRGRGSSQSGGEGAFLASCPRMSMLTSCTRLEFARQRSPKSSPKSLPNGDRYSKVRKQEGPLLQPPTRASLTRPPLQPLLALHHPSPLPPRQNLFRLPPSLPPSLLAPEAETSSTACLRGSRSGRFVRGIQLRIVQHESMHTDN